MVNIDESSIDGIPLGSNEDFTDGTSRIDGDARVVLGNKDEDGAELTVGLTLPDDVEFSVGLRLCVTVI